MDLRRTGSVFFIVTVIVSGFNVGGRLFREDAMKKFLVFCAVLSGLLAKEGEQTMKITSPSFEHKGAIPMKFTCQGDDISPALNWTGIPDGTKSLVLIVDDPDAPDPAAPKMIWVHWVLYNLPPETKGLPENVVPGNLPNGTMEGLNDWGRTGYGGPCPPIGRHRYFHKLYALDVTFPDLGRPTKAELIKAMEGHILDYTELIGTYIKSK